MKDREDIPRLEIELTTFNVDCYTEHNFHTFYEDQMKKVNEWKKVYLENMARSQDMTAFNLSDKITFRVFDDYDTPEAILQLYRWESDAEYEKRVEKVLARRIADENRRKSLEGNRKKKAQLKKQKEYEQYLLLKKKFEIE